MVRWRDNGGQRARRFATEAEAIAFGCDPNGVIVNVVGHPD